jgi:hypothetical protein
MLRQVLLFTACIFLLLLLVFLVILKGHTSPLLPPSPCSSWCTLLALLLLAASTTTLLCWLVLSFAIIIYRAGQGQELAQLWWQLISVYYRGADPQPLQLPGCTSLLAKQGGGS